jgi:hypothetical protein
MCSVDGLLKLTQNSTITPLAIALSGVGRGQWGEIMGVIEPIYNVSLFGIVTMNSPSPVQQIYPN